MNNSSAFKNILTYLVIAAIVILAVLSIYEVFLRPPDDLPSSNIQPVNTYYGEDVLDFIQR